MEKTKADLKKDIETLKNRIKRSAESNAEDRCAALVARATEKKIARDLEDRDHTISALKRCLTKQRIGLEAASEKIADQAEDLDVKNKRIGDLRIEAQDRYTRAIALTEQRNNAVSALFRATRSVRLLTVENARARLALKRAKHALFPDMKSHDLRPATDNAVRTLMILMSAIEAPSAPIREDK